MAENSASQGSSQGRKEPDPDLGLVEKDGAIGTLPEIRDKMAVARAH